MKQFIFVSVFVYAGIVGFLTSDVVLADDPAHAAIRQALSEVMPGEKDYTITRLQVPGIYEVDFGDGFIYLTADGKYAIRGDILDLKNNVNLTEVKRSQARLEALARIDKADMLIYPADKERKHTITVFTDIDCGYCRRLHQGIKGYTSRGIEVRYAFFPRAGKNSDSYKKAVSVWCADDQHKAMDMAKAGRSIEQRQCTNPVNQHMDIAEALGVSGTPTIFTEDGKRLPGYVQAPQLELMLNQQAASSQ